MSHISQTIQADRQDEFLMWLGDESPLTERVWDWLSWLTSCGRSPRTVEAYARDLREFVAWTEVSIEEMTTGDVLRYQTHLGRRLSKASVARKLDALSSFCKWCVRMGILERNPVADVPRNRPQSRVAKFMSRGEGQRVLEVIHAPVERCTFLLAYQAGLRRSELKSVTVSDLDMERQRLTVYATKTDTTRVVPLTDLLTTELRSFLGTRPACDCEELLVTPRGNPLCNTTLYRWLRRWLEEAEVEHYRLHDLRHSAASNLADAGYAAHEIRDMLGHASIETTSQYLHSDLGRMQRKIDRIDFENSQLDDNQNSADAVVRQIRLGMAQAVKAGDTQTAQQLAAALENITAA
jgi:integrase/recombinase XerC